MYNLDYEKFSLILEYSYKERSIQIAKFIIKKVKGFKKLY